MVPKIDSGLGLPADQHRAVARSYAQLEQDLWVLSHTGHKSHGVFVEFGATDGVWLSNT